MFWFIKNYLDNKKFKKEYELKKGEYFDKIVNFLHDWKISSKEKAELDKMIEEYKLQAEDLVNIHKEVCSYFFKIITDDTKITEDEKKNLENLMEYLKLQSKDFNFDQVLFNKSYVLGLLDEWKLPEIKNHDINIIFKEWEILHRWCPSVLRKYKRITERINYWWLSWSIKIMKWVRYRAWSISMSTQSKEYLIPEDSGPFWITNKRIWFKWYRKNFIINYDKIHAFELTNDWLIITKEWKDTPYIIWLDDYDVPCAVISNILNSKNI